MSDKEGGQRLPGIVYTFYSYKGGVGRSMALANVGVIMANEGLRVLLVDWDLEAPGLEVYFRKTAKLHGDPAQVGGIVDLLEAHADGRDLQWRNCLLKAEFLGHSLDIISAGRRSDDYRRRVQQLDWETLFREHRIGNFVNRLRDEWREAYDVVLVDSRTGITDIGDICTVLLPDVLVMLFVTNHQNIEGIKDVMARAVRARAKLPINRSKLLAVPIPARDERDREYQKSVEWQKIFANEFGEIFRDWLPKEVAPIDALNKLFIPYVASWSFGEAIPVLESERETSDPTSLGAAYARLATLLAHRLDWRAIDARASVDELTTTRVALSSSREAAREAEAARAAAEAARAAAETAQRAAEDRLKATQVVRAPARRWFTVGGSIAAILIAAAVLLLYPRYFPRDNVPREGVLIQRLDSPDAKVRAETINKLVFSLEPGRQLAVAPKIATLLKDPSPEVRSAAAATLTLFDQTGRYDDALIAALKDADPHVRNSALASFGIERFKYASNVAALLNDPDSSVRKGAIEALGRMRADQFGPQLEARIFDPAAEVRAAAIDALTVLGPQTVAAHAPKIGAALHDANEPVRAAAKKALETLGPAGDKYLRRGK